MGQDTRCAAKERGGRELRGSSRGITHVWADCTEFLYTRRTDIMHNLWKIFLFVVCVGGIHERFSKALDIKAERRDRNLSENAA